MTRVWRAQIARLLGDLWGEPDSERLRASKGSELDTGHRIPTRSGTYPLTGVDRKTMKNNELKTLLKEFWRTKPELGPGWTWEWQLQLLELQPGGWNP